jgi:ComF family protein
MRLVTWGLGQALTNLGREALRIVLPSWCIVCAKDLPWRDRVASCCESCWRALPRIEGARCRSCARELPAGAHAETICLGCRESPIPVGWADAWGHYEGGLERVLHAFKFERHDFLDVPLAALLEERLRERGDLGFDALVPVPMSPRKERRRGYNQAGLLARALGPRIGVDCAPPLLERHSERATQSSLPKRDRAANVRGAFRASALARGRSILIVDDICTTGETLRACAAALQSRGAARVCALSVAKAS